eukprot:CAMPEP_0197525422 /NCGR_PEP_ID=MMETSP1318-20131121/11914_1 /TAXON_ID=552666 /ORGANISM="Partenskyella glossopodia, Strain RCC365" /LENGTH=349 /DNA_ID=CAMNT_0043078811 /DNA_START=346 /DNA_END=1395 /DNA_ORIENTATION=+
MGGEYTSVGATVLRSIQDAGIPYVLMTNGGGGRTEGQYAKEINQKLQSFGCDGGECPHIPDDRMILSYTPFNADLKHLKDKPVLIVGTPRAMDVAEHYGFQKAMHIKEYCCRHPTLNPFGTSGCEKDDCVINPGRGTSEEDFAAILVFTDPENFFEGIQVLTDVLLSSNPEKTEYEPNRRIPVVFSNPDLLWKAQHPHARFGQGAFRLALEVCYKARLQSLGLGEQEIEDRLGDFVQYGKPVVSQMRHTKQALVAQEQELGCKISKYYVIGDNPHSDIQGARNMDQIAEEKLDTRWSGILVRTGVYKDGDDTAGADVVCDDVLGAVKHVFQEHKNELKLKSKKSSVSLI